MKGMCGSATLIDLEAGPTQGIDPEVGDIDVVIDDEHPDHDAPPAGTAPAVVRGDRAA